MGVQKDEGGPISPVSDERLAQFSESIQNSTLSESEKEDLLTTVVERGIGLCHRDYFAAKAMQAYLSGADRDSFTPEQWAAVSYQMADAMLKARKL